MLNQAPTSVFPQILNLSSYSSVSSYVFLHLSVTSFCQTFISVAWGRPESARWKLTFNVNIKWKYPSACSHFANTSTETCLIVFGDLLLVNEWCHEFITRHFTIKHGGWNNHTCRVLCPLSFKFTSEISINKFEIHMFTYWFKQSSNTSTQFQHSKKCPTIEFASRVCPTKNSSLLMLKYSHWLQCELCCPR